MGWKLATIPPEIVAQILDFAGTFYAIELWKCGDKGLNYVLSTADVTSIDIVDHTKHSLSRWPKVLSSFQKLRHLSVYRMFSRLDCPDSIRRQLFLLGPRLEHLELTMHELMDVLLDPFAIWNLAMRLFDESTAHTDENPLINAIPTNELGIRSFQWQMTPHFPNLRILKLSFPPHRSLPCQSFDPSCLPNQLTHFTLESSLKQLTVDFAKSLPRTLLSLYMKFQTITFDQNACENLPQSLTDLNGRFVFPLDAKLPSSLQLLYTSNTLAIEAVKTLQNLHTFFIDTLQIRTLAETALFPHALTSLSIRNSTIEITSKCILMLPRSLWTLALPAISELSDLKVEYFPPALTSLDLSRSAEFNAADCKNLPPTLLVLRLYGFKNQEHQKHSIVVFPPLLKSLCFERISHGHFYDAPGLTQLKVVEIVTRTQEDIEMLVRYLPPSLRLLHINIYHHGNDYDYEHITRAISGLTSMEKIKIDTDGKLSLSVLPRSLLSIVWRNSPEHLYEDFQCLPPGLTSLVLGSRWNWKVLAKRHLIAKFRKLGIHFDEGNGDMVERMKLEATNLFSEEEQEDLKIICDTWITRLIPFMAQLLPKDKHYHQTIRLIPKWLHLLPRTLTSLIGPEVLGEDLPNLPPNLKHCYFRTHWVSKAHIQSLPISLRNIHLVSLQTVSHPNDTIQDSDFPLRCAFDCGCYKLRVRENSWHSQHNNPIVTPDPRISETNLRYRR